MPKIVAITQARMGSERLPGKHLLQVGDAPMLGHLIRRMKQIQGVDDIVIATTTNRMDDAIEELCTEYDVQCFRGSEHDVLGRTLEALQSRDADIAVQIYGDGPLFDPRLAEECLSEYKKMPCDMVCNDLKPGFPSGMFVECFPISTLIRASQEYHDPKIREHVSVCIRTHPEQYTISYMEPDANLRRSEYHLDVDTSKDMELIFAIMQHFSPRTNFSLEEIITFLDANPDVLTLNANVHRRWKQYQQEDS